MNLDESNRELLCIFTSHPVCVTGNIKRCPYVNKNQRPQLLKKYLPSAPYVSMSTLLLFPKPYVKITIDNYTQKYTRSCLNNDSYYYHYYYSQR